MTILRLLAIAGLIAASTLAGAPTAAQTAEERRQLDWTLERGRLLYALDRSAWVATDDLRSRMPNLQSAGLLGYIVDNEGGRLTAIFFGREDERLVAIYKARIGDRGVQSPQLFVAGARPALTPVQRRLAEALLYVRGSVHDLERCGNQPFNTAVVPPASEQGPIDVYLMTPQTTQGLPFGGHHRITLDAQGKEIGRRSFARSCLTMPVPPANAEGIFVNHLLDPIPTEIHVFTALAARKPVFVGTEQRGRLWRVEPQRISLMPAPRR